MDLGLLVQMLRNLIEVLKLLDGAKPSASSSGLELLLAARSSEDGFSSFGGHALPPKMLAPHYVKREADAAWECLQVCTKGPTFTHTGLSGQTSAACGLCNLDFWSIMYE